MEISVHNKLSEGRRSPFVCLFFKSFLHGISPPSVFPGFNTPKAMRDDRNDSLDIFFLEQLCAAVTMSWLRIAGTNPSLSLQPEEDCWPLWFVLPWNDSCVSAKVCALRKGLMEKLCREVNCREGRFQVNVTMQNRSCFYKHSLCTTAEEFEQHFTQQ